MRKETKNPKGQGLETDHTLRTALLAYLMAKPWKAMVCCWMADALSRWELVTQVLNSDRSLGCQIPHQAKQELHSCPQSLVCRGHTRVHAVGV